MEAIKTYRPNSSMYGKQVKASHAIGITSRMCLTPDGSYWLNQGPLRSGEDDVWMSSHEGPTAKGVAHYAELQRIDKIIEEA